MQNSNAPSIGHAQQSVKSTQKTEQKMGDLTFGVFNCSTCIYDEWSNFPCMGQVLVTKQVKCPHPFPYIARGRVVGA